VSGHLLARAAGPLVRRRAALTSSTPLSALSALTALVCVGAGLSGCAAADVRVTPSSSAAGASSSGASGASGASGTSPGSAGSAGAGSVGLVALLPEGSSLVATANVGHLRVLAAPGGAPVATLANPIPDGSPLVLRVVEDVAGDAGGSTAGTPGRWLRVQLPQRPNGSTGWVAEADVRLSRTPYRLVVHRGTHRLEVWRDGALGTTYPVGIGTSVNPTPAGTYYLTELLVVPDPKGPYGPYAFGLSAFSTTLTTFAGGPGQLGLHGTNEPSKVGSDVSHGCLRLTNQAITTLAHQLPLGTPLVIAA